MRGTVLRGACVVAATLVLGSVILHPSSPALANHDAEAQRRALTAVRENGEPRIRVSSKHPTGTMVGGEGLSALWVVREEADGLMVGDVDLRVRDGGGPYRFTFDGSPFTPRSLPYDLYRTTLFCDREVFVLALTTYLRAPQVQDPRYVFEWLVMEPGAREVSSIVAGWPDDPSYEPQTPEALRRLHEPDCSTSPPSFTN